jgi:Right handed beta helix region
MVLSSLAVISLAQPASSGAARPQASVSAFGGPTCTVTVATENGGNNAIQTAINANPGGTICVGPGLFPEQIHITSSHTTLIGSGTGNAGGTIIEPASPVTLNTYDYDSSSTWAGLAPYAAIIEVSNTTTNHPTTGVTIEDLQVNGTAGSATFASDGCADGYIGVDFQNASGTLSNATVSDIAQPVADFGCQTGTGLAIYAYNGIYYSGIASTVAVTINNTTVPGYQKNGITCDDLGVTCTITNNVVTGIGPTDLTGQNGIQVAVGANATVTGNHVSANVWSPADSCSNSYFSLGTCTGNGYNFAGGIIIVEAGSSVSVSSNTLFDNQVDVWEYAGPITVSGNTISSFGFYGIIVDFNESEVGGSAGVFATGPYTSSVTDNAISGVNVGVLVYDDNATVHANTFSGVNVSIEAETDLAASYTIAVTGNTGHSNVSGALLGDVSSYQPGDAATVPSGTYTVTGNAFTNSSSVSPSSVPYGVLVTGAQATAVSGNLIHNFANGIALIISGGATASDNTVSAASPTTGGNGLYLFVDTAVVSGNTITGFAWNTGPSWWANSQSAGIFGECLNNCSLTGNTLTDDSVGIAMSSYSYGEFPSPDWPNAAPPSNGPLYLNDNTITDSNTFGMAFELNQQTSASDKTPAVKITDNTVNNTISGAVGLMVDQGAYTIDNNVFIGTSSSGSSGSSQTTCPTDDTILTASIEVLDACDSVTRGNIAYNQYIDTTLYASLLNLTAGAPNGQYAVILGEPVVFTESGLPTGTLWNVTVAGYVFSSTTKTIAIDVPPGTHAYKIGLIPGYKTRDNGNVTAVDSTTTGQASKIKVTVSFSLVTYSVKFEVKGLTAGWGTTWTVTLTPHDGPSVEMSSSTTDPMDFSGLVNGTYTYSVGHLANYTLGSASCVPSRDCTPAGGYSGTVTVSGATVTVTLPFKLMTYTVTFTLAAQHTTHQTWQVTFGGKTTVVTTTKTTFKISNGSYAYTIISSGYSCSGTPPSPVTVSGGASVTVTCTADVPHDGPEAGPTASASGVQAPAIAGSAGLEVRRS